MQVTQTPLAGVLLIEPGVHGDKRGFFMETFQVRRYAEAGIPGPFVQDNLSSSRRGTLRGLHFQNPQAQGKLVQVFEGEVFDVAVDIRPSSPSFGKWFGASLSGDNKLQMYVPEGFAHGFCVTSETALFGYKCTDYYNPETEGGILWNDPAIGIEWPIASPELSAKDREAPRLRDIALSRLEGFRL